MVMRECHPNLLRFLKALLYFDLSQIACSSESDVSIWGPLKEVVMKVPGLVNHI